MKQTVYYKYLGTNGTIETTVHLEDVYYVRLLKLEADEGKILTNGSQKVHIVKIPEEELSQWKEINE